MHSSQYVIIQLKLTIQSLKWLSGTDNLIYNKKDRQVADEKLAVAYNNIDNCIENFKLESKTASTTITETSNSK